ncbi:crotonase/enoyl-CoA hydratase family protein [Knoellia subterranea]|uniref:Enoyl-CoA hydratase n=1 Tax=Knoellia subterranea KCTC 19937 TaxID=1385521 RepID=A0A0A0JFI1_9MICO|nr:crotonase/enoyl-CoA hydratase family protein [Knoellia subterranea]KGN36185.1 enoyl-CoA hydratase [Knoellia subterranea KCTC 19937]
MDFTTLSHTVDEGVLTVTLDRPEQLNSFTTTMADELERTFRDANERDDVRGIIVTGAGRAFCAGMDLTAGGNVFGLDASLRPGFDDLADLDGESARAVRDTGGRVTLAIHDCRKPVVAAINGAAVGIGATMTLAMDARLASEKARIGFVFGRLGIVPEACSSFFLPRIVGLDKALDLILTADILDAHAALDVGLVRAVHAPEDLLAQARALIDTWTLGRSPVGVALARQLILRNAAASSPLEAHFADSLAMFWTSIGDGDEGVHAFLEKRSPNYGSRASEMPPFYDDWIARSSARRLSD